MIAYEVGYIDIFVSTHERITDRQSEAMVSNDRIGCDTILDIMICYKMW